MHIRLEMALPSSFRCSQGQKNNAYNGMKSREQRSLLKQVYENQTFVPCKGDPPDPDKARSTAEKEP